MVREIGWPRCLGGRAGVSAISSASPAQAATSCSSQPLITFTANRSVHLAKLLVGARRVRQVNDSENGTSCHTSYFWHELKRNSLSCWGYFYCLWICKTANNCCWSSHCSLHSHKKRYRSCHYGPNLSKGTKKHTLDTNMYVYNTNLHPLGGKDDTKVYI